MPVYNAQKYLSEAIDSVLAQTFDDWELILINDGSTDRSKAIIERYRDSRIRYVENEQNMGLIATLNKGIDLCEGEYIARMDADDIAMPDRLSMQTDFLDRHADYVMCGTDAIVIDANGQQTGKIKNLCRDALLQINLLFTNPFIHPTMLIRRRILINNRYNVHYRHTEDYELWCRLAKLGKVANLNAELLKYRWHNTNVSVVYNDIQQNLKDEIIRRKLYDVFGLEPDEEELSVHKITFQLYSLGKKIEVPVNCFNNISDWFIKLIKKNEEIQYYDNADLTAFLWSRWLVLCFSQGKKRRALFPPFASYSPRTLMRLFKLSLYLMRK